MREKVDKALIYVKECEQLEKLRKSFSQECSRIFGWSVREIGGWRVFADFLGWTGQVKVKGVKGT